MLHEKHLRLPAIPESEQHPAGNPQASPTQDAWQQGVAPHLASEAPTSPQPATGDSATPTHSKAVHILGVVSQHALDVTE